MFGKMTAYLQEKEKRKSRGLGDGTHGSGWLGRQANIFALNAGHFFFFFTICSPFLSVSPYIILVTYLHGNDHLYIILRDTTLERKKEKLI